MSKYSDQLKETYCNSTKKIREATKDVIKKGRDFALKEFHDANSIERIKKEIMKGG